jgi:2,4-dienoyl-CoA reductase-like NADH-dependent reductase (Old Yellow Enzyme family)
MLFEPLVAPTIRFANRAVMAPMTRSRAIDAVHAQTFYTPGANGRTDYPTLPA